MASHFIFCFGNFAEKMSKMLPNHISIIFIVCIAYTFYCLYKAGLRSTIFLSVIGLWLVVHLALSYNGYYLKTYSLPPRFVLLLGPPLLMMIVVFGVKKLRNRIMLLDMRWLVALSIVRMPVELVLYFLMKENLVPGIITFEGRNWDFLSGIVAVPLTYCLFKQIKPAKKWVLIWNIVAFVLLLNVVIHALLSAPTPFQQISFNQPNIGVFYFPVALLPGFVVPSVLFTHVWIYLKLNSRNKTG